MTKRGKQTAEERLYWLGFSVCPGIGPTRFKLLIDRFGSARDAWNAKEKDLEIVIGKALTQKFLQFRESFSVEAYANELRQKAVSFLISSEDAYPTLLTQIKNPPFVLFVKGNRDFNNINHHSVGIVGTRKITSYGKEVTQMITADLVAAGCAIVSGLALGVDAVSHSTAIKNNGKTIAVLGCGVDLCYPSTNQDIYNSILTTGGAIVSEYPVGQQPSIGSFPSRNRIIAGLSEAVVVTEGAEDSGALITASHAISLDRSVFAVPGQITSSLSRGPLKLLQQGAKMVTSAEDILKELGLGSRKISRLRQGFGEPKGETEEEQKIIDLLQNEPLHFDEIVRRVGMTSVTLSALLSVMELKGMVTSDASVFSLTL